MSRRRRIAAAAAIMALPVIGVAEAAPAQVAHAATVQQAHRRRIPKRLRAYRWAVSRRGHPYIWGGTGPYGYDCSGLVQAAYRHIGIYLPRTTYEMLADHRQLRRIPQRDARKGDLAFFGSGHVELVDYARKYHWTFGALEPGTLVWWHRFNRWWHPTAYYRVIGAG